MSHIADTLAEKETGAGFLLEMPAIEKGRFSANY